MIHPHVEDLHEISDAELDKRISKLNSAYFMTENGDLRQQMILLIDGYKLELEARKARQRLEQENKDDNNDLDNLINVS